jgi:Sap, sulfolipid-1-addressing protein
VECLLEEPNTLDLWSNLAPLIVVSALLPLQTIVTLSLVRSSVKAAFAWVAGMAAVRLVQGVVFGVVLAESEAHAAADSPEVFLGTVLLVLAILLYVKALRTALGAEEEDAPPPSWLTRAGSMSPLSAFFAGAAFMTISVKFLVFTLGALGAIADAHLDRKLSALTFVLFVVLTQVLPLTVVVLGASGSPRPREMLDKFGAWLRSKNRLITMMFGLIFGSWFLIKALMRLRVIQKYKKSCISHRPLDDYQCGLALAS